MKADLRISIKDYHRNKNLRILLFRPPFPCRQFLVRMNGAPVADRWRAGVVNAAADGLAQAAGEGGPCWRYLSRITLTSAVKQVRRGLARGLLARKAEGERRND